MKKLLNFTTVIALIASLSSCKKETTPDSSVQRPDLSNTPGNTKSATIQINNLSLQNKEKVTAVYLSSAGAVPGNFPVQSLDTKFFQTTNMGKRIVYIMVEGLEGSSISIVDSDGVKQCKNIPASTKTLVNFEDVNITPYKNVEINYSPSQCQ